MAARRRNDRFKVEDKIIIKASYSFKVEEIELI